MPARSLSDSSHPPHARVPTSSARPGTAPRTPSRVNCACYGGARPFRGTPAGSRSALARSGTGRIVREEAARGQRRAEQAGARGAT
jgi:putative hemolysin